MKILSSRDIADKLHQLSYFLESEASRAQALNSDNWPAIALAASEVREFAAQLHDMKARLVDIWHVEKYIEEKFRICDSLKGFK